MRKIYKTGWHRIIDKNGKARKYNYKPSNWKNKEVKYDKHLKAYITDNSYSYVQEKDLPPDEYFEKPINKYYRTEMTYNYIAKKGARKGLTETIRIWIYTNEPNVTDNELIDIKEKFSMENPFLDYIEFSQGKIEGREINEETDYHSGNLNEWNCIFEIGNKGTTIKAKYKR
jgi:hypothetical protein